MWSRREQHHAYTFLTRRIVSAVLTGEPETNELPMRRFGVSLFSGVAVALLVVAGFTIYGLLVPGGGRPQENVIILERETGAIYVYTDGRLHPVLNWASARLMLGQVPVRTMAQASLRDVPRGRSVGIPGAPDSLPDKSSLVGLPWSVCSAPRSPDSVEFATHVLPGQVPAGGRRFADDEGLLVRSGEQRFLIWQDRRLWIREDAVLVALDWAGVPPVPVTTAFLDAIPAGPDLAPLELAGAGAATPHTVAGQPGTVGQLYRIASTGRHYVMVADGVVPVGELTARLWHDRAVIQTSEAEISRLLVDASVEPEGLPRTVPRAYGAEGPLAVACAAYGSAAGADPALQITAYAAAPEELTAIDPWLYRGSGADRVAVPGGRGALAVTRTPEGSPAPGAVFLITDEGLRYPLAADDEQTGVSTAAVLASLGFEGVQPVAVPAAILDLIPLGPVLDPASATAFAPPPGSP